VAVEEPRKVALEGQMEGQAKRMMEEGVVCCLRVCARMEEALVASCRLEAVLALKE
jgi:hypothetical protein